MSANHEKTLSILTEIRGGNRAAVDDLLAHVYDDLRELAAVHMRREHGHTLQPTALINEAYFGRRSTLEASTVIETAA